MCIMWKGLFDLTGPHLVAHPPNDQALLYRCVSIPEYGRKLLQFRRGRLCSQCSKVQPFPLFSTDEATSYQMDLTLKLE